MPGRREARRTCSQLIQPPSAHPEDRPRDDGTGGPRSPASAAQRPQPPIPVAGAVWRARPRCRKSFPLQGPTSNDVEVLDALAEVPVLRFLALQLDLQPDLVGGIGEAQRVLVADAAGLVQIEEGLVEGLHAQLARLLHDLLDLVDLAL